MTDWAPPSWSMGDRIRKARESARWTLEELASASGVARQSIGPWEAGARTPSPAALAQVVRALAVRLGAPEDALLAWIRAD